MNNCPICREPIPEGGCIHYGPELIAHWDAQERPA